MIRRSHRSCAMLDHLSKPAGIWLRPLLPPVDTTTSPSCSLVLDQAARSDVSLSWGGKSMSGFKTVSKRMFVLIAALALAGMMLPAFSQTKRRPKYTLPSETVLRVRMNDKLTSKTAQVGSHFQTTVVTPVYAKGVQVIPAGAIVMGKVTHV